MQGWANFGQFFNGIRRISAQINHLVALFGFDDRKVQMKILGLEIRLKAAENEVMQKSLTRSRGGELSSKEKKSMGSSPGKHLLQD